MRNTRRKISPIFILSLIGFFFSVAQQQVFAEHPSKLPTIKIPSSVFNFGSVRQGAVVDHVFTLENTGDYTLVIHDIFPSCGCTAAVINSSEIAPHSTTELKVSFNTEGFSGHKVKTVRLYTNDPSNESPVLTIEGTVIPPIIVDPPRLNFGTVERMRSNLKVSTKVSVAPNEKFEIIGVESQSPHLDVTISSIKAAGSKGGTGSRDREITAQLKSTVPFGIFRADIALKTSNPNEPIVPIPVFARVQGDLVLNPADISFGLLEGPIASPISQEVILLNNSSIPLSVISVDSDDSNVTGEIIDSKDPKRLVIRVSLRAGTTGTLRGRIRILTNHPDPEQSSIFLPVYGIITKKGS